MREECLVQGFGSGIGLQGLGVMGSGFRAGLHLGQLQGIRVQSLGFRLQGFRVCSSHLVLVSMIINTKPNPKLLYHIAGCDALSME